MEYYTFLAASVYGTDTYGGGAYQEVAGTSTGTNSGGDLLANTGYDIIVPVSLGLSIVVASIIVLVKKSRSKKQQV